MNATSRTLAFVLVAGVAAAAAIGARVANRPASIEGYSDIGQEFFPDFRNPLKASALSVVKYDKDAKEPLSFSVNQNDKGLWVIPSHHNYPAEAKERLAKTAAGLIGIKKVAMQTRSKDDWKRYGVLDPSDESTLSVTAEDDKDPHGTRITLRDSSSNALVDLIVGLPVEGKDKHFYVRQPDKNPVFIAKLDADLSAKFADWIEPDLLKIAQEKINSLVVDRYSVDEAQGAIIAGEMLKLTKNKPADGTAAKWALEGLNAETEALKDLPVTDLVRNIDQLKIVGIRPKPEGLNADLTVSQEVASNPLVRQILQADMQRQGFFIAKGPQGQVQLVSNEGEIVAGTNEGVKYTLYFGEVARGTAKDIETGLNQPADAAADAPKDAAAPDVASADAAADPNAPKPPTPVDESKDEESGPRRYLLVKVEYDESLLGPVPAEPVAPVKPEILNDAAAPADAASGTAPPAAQQGEGAAPVEPATEPTAEPTAEPAVNEASPEAAATPAETPPTEATTEKPPEPGACDEPVAAEPSQETPAAADPPATEPAAATDAAPTETANEPAPAQDASSTQPPTTDNTAPPVVDPAVPVVDPAAQLPVQPPVDPKAEAEKQYQEALSKYTIDKENFDSDVKSREERIKAGKKAADDLSRRFGSWYYVISADSYEKFKVTRADIVGPKEEPKPATGAGAATPGLGGGLGLPNFDLPAGGTP